MKFQMLRMQIILIAKANHTNGFKSKLVVIHTTTVWEPMYACGQWQMINVKREPTSRRC